MVDERRGVKARMADCVVCDFRGRFSGLQIEVDRGETNRGEATNADAELGAGLEHIRNRT
jgi:hypothetical protein